MQRSYQVSVDAESAAELYASKAQTEVVVTSAAEAIITAEAPRARGKKISEGTFCSKGTN